MTTTDQEKVFKTGLKIKALALEGIDGEMNAAKNRLHFYLEKFEITLKELNDFEVKISSGFRIEYLENVFYNQEDLIEYLKTQPLPKQAEAFFTILFPLIKNRFFKKEAK